MFDFFKHIFGNNDIPDMPPHHQAPEDKQEVPAPDNQPLGFSEDVLLIVKDMYKFNSPNPDVFKAIINTDNSLGAVEYVWNKYHQKGEIDSVTQKLYRVDIAADILNKYRNYFFKDELAPIDYIALMILSNEVSNRNSTREDREILAQNVASKSKMNLFMVYYIIDFSHYCFFNNRDVFTYNNTLKNAFEEAKSSCLPKTRIYQNILDFLYPEPEVKEVNDIKKENKPVPKPVPKPHDIEDKQVEQTKVLPITSNDKTTIIEPHKNDDKE